MTREGWLKAAVFALFAAPLATVVFSTWRFRWTPEWRMDPIPFGFFLISAYFLGRYNGSHRRRDG